MRRGEDARRYGELLLLLAAAAADWLQSFAMLAAWLASVDAVLKILPLRLFTGSKGEPQSPGKTAESWEAYVKKK